MESVWSVSKFSTESVGSRRELVANCVHTADADATKVSSRRRRRCVWGIRVRARCFIASHLFRCDALVFVGPMRYKLTLTPASIRDPASIKMKANLKKVKVTHTM